MCLAIPGRILSVVGDDPAFRMALVDICGVQKTVSLAYTPEALVGDFVLTHLGFAVSRVVMHEMGIACSILEAVQREHDRCPGQQVSKVGVRIGELAGVDRESLQFCFQAIAAPVALELENGKLNQELEIAYMELS